MARKEIGQKGLVLLGLLALALLGGCVQKADRTTTGNDNTPTTPTSTNPTGDGTLPTSVTSTREQSYGGFQNRAAADVLNEGFVRGTLDDGDEIL